MVETNVKCVMLKSDRRSICRMNEFCGIHCSASEEEKVADMSRGETGKSRTSPCLVAGMSQACRGLVADVTGKSAKWNLGLTIATLRCRQCENFSDYITAAQ